MAIGKTCPPLLLKIIQIFSLVLRCKVQSYVIMLICGYLPTICTRYSANKFGNILGS